MLEFFYRRTGPARACWARRPYRPLRTSRRYHPFWGSGYSFRGPLGCRRSHPFGPRSNGPPFYPLGPISQPTPFWAIFDDARIIRGYLAYWAVARPLTCAGPISPSQLTDIACCSLTSTISHGFLNTSSLRAVCAQSFFDGLADLPGSAAIAESEFSESGADTAATCENDHPGNPPLERGLVNPSSSEWEVE